MIAAELANLKDGQRADRVAGSIDPPTAAKLLNVSEPSVERAKAVMRDAIPEVVKLFEEGRLAVPVAACLFPEPEKGGRGQKGVSKTLSHARTVLELAPDLVQGVKAGETSLAAGGASPGSWSSRRRRAGT